MADLVPFGHRTGFVHLAPPAAPVISLVSFTGGVAVVSVAYEPGAVSFGLFVGSSSGGESLLNAVINASQAPAPGPTLITLTGLSLSQPTFIVAAASNASGYGPVSNEVTSVGELIYFGFVPTATPNASQVAAMASNLLQVFAGTYVCTQSPGPGYFCLAWPAAFGALNNCSVGGFPYNLQASTVTIGGISYNVYLNPFATFDPSLTVVVS